MYKMSMPDYKKKAAISRRYELVNRIVIPTEDKCFIKVKDHKAGFPGRLECRLINLDHNHLGSFSKHTLNKPNKTIREKTK